MNISTQGGAAHDAARRNWMAVLARAPREALKAALARHRAGDGAGASAGDAFNLGEVTVTRTMLRLTLSQGGAPVGVAVHMGRDKERARLATFADALLQTDEYAARVRDRVIEPLAARLANEKRRKQDEAASTRVEFFTMVRGE